MVKKVLILTSTFPRWKNDTTPAFVYELANRLWKKNRKILVLAPHAYTSSKREKLGNVEVYRFQYFFPSKLQKVAYGAGIITNVKSGFIAKLQIPFFLISEYFVARSLIRKHKPEILHAHWIVPQGIICAILKKCYKIPLIVTIHGSDLFPLKNIVFRYLQKIVLSNCDICTVNSIATKNELIKRFPNFRNKLVTIPMGVDTKLFESKKIKHRSIKYSDKKIILFVGRLNEQKGLEYLIEAVNIAKDKIPDIKLLIIGEGNYKTTLKRLVDYLKISDCVEFLGAVPHEKTVYFYNLANIFVLPSITSKIGTEGLGLVLLEAMAAKVPVIGTSTGGMRYIIKNKETGILVKEKNSEELASAIVLLLSDEKLREKIIRNANKFVNDNYSWNAIVNKFNKLYEKIK